MVDKWGYELTNICVVKFVSLWILFIYFFQLNTHKYVIYYCWVIQLLWLFIVIVLTSSCCALSCSSFYYMLRNVCLVGGGCRRILSEFRFLFIFLGDVWGYEIRNFWVCIDFLRIFLKINRALRINLMIFEL